MFFGLDFGTTNSALAVARPDGSVALTALTPGAAEPQDRDTVRSLLYFDGEERGPDRRPLASVGRAAIDAALDPIAEGRLVQSVKSYLANPGFQSTQIFGARYGLADLVALILSEIRTKAEARFGPLPARLVAGRPARFVGESHEDLALTRLRDALAFSGFEEVAFEYEPVAAAYAYESRLSTDELVLIGDFGGGTSDFCLLQVGPNRPRGGEAILAVDGVGRAGDALDGRIVDAVIAPALGRGAHYKTPLGKRLPVPNWLYEHIKHWHQLSFLDTHANRSLLEELRQGAEDPEALEGLSALVEENRGFRLARAVEAVKIALSSAETAELAFDSGPVSLRREIARAEFEAWIKPELGAIEDCVARLLGAAGNPHVDAVFLTGGTSFIPAVRGIFERRFGAQRIKSGGELVSVATGLALAARDRFSA